MMKASKINPSSWLYGRGSMTLMRKWEGILKSTKLMENTMLELMNNPETTADQLVTASKLYTNVTKQLHDHAMMIDVYIYHGHKLKHMTSCPTYTTGIKEHCVCKDWQEGDNNVS
jgi:hypothetical protein